jgi:hypothetical protein
MLSWRETPTRLSVIGAGNWCVWLGGTLCQAYRQAAPEWMKRRNSQDKKTIPDDPVCPRKNQWLVIENRKYVYKDEW